MLCRLLKRIAKRREIPSKCVYVSEYARMWYEYAFGFEIAYRCLIWWLRKKVYLKNLFYIFQCVLLLHSFSFVCFAFLRGLKMKQKKIIILCSNCQLFAIPYRANVWNSNQFQFFLNVLRFTLMFFAPTSSSSSLSHSVYQSCSISTQSQWICDQLLTIDSTCEHFSLEAFSHCT